MADYIPSSDAPFDGWLSRFNTYCVANQVALGLKPAQANKLTAVTSSWHTAYNEHQAAQTAARAKTQNKTDKHDEAVEIIRQITGIIQANPDVTDEQRRAAGLPVAGDQPSIITSEESIGAGINAPILLSPDFSQRGRCTIHFGPNPSNERQNAKPRGVKGAKIWFSVGGLPAQDGDWQWLADDTSSPYLHILGNSQPTTVAYRAQYFDSRMNLGPLSDPVIVTITA
jgi:hypothetical protein